MRAVVVAFVGGVALAVVSAQAAPLPPRPTAIELGAAPSVELVAPADEPSVIRVQGWPGWPRGWQGPPGWSPDQERREHCWRLRTRAHEIRERMHHAPPWEREGMERQLWEIRERARGECRDGEWD